jgi:hypothetical protein
MRRKIAVVGDPDVVAASRQHAEVVQWPSPNAAGADVVVVATDDRLGEVADFIARRTPAAVVIATDAAWCGELLARTCFPRGRVLATADVAAVVDAVLGESGAELDVTVRHDGEHGQDGFRRVRARVGAGGVVAV